MHICFLNPPEEYYSPISGGAISTIIMEVSRCLITRGHKVSVITKLNEDETYRSGEIVPINIPSRRDLSLVQRCISSFRRRINHWNFSYYEYYRSAFLGALHKLKPDAVILFNNLVSSPSIRHVLPNSHIVVWLQNEWRTHPAHLQELIACTNTFLTCSEYIRFWTAAEHGISHEHLKVAGSGVDLDAFQPDPDFLQISSPLRVLFIGRIDPNKGPDIVTDAVALLQRRGVKIRLTVAGGLWWYGHGKERENSYFRHLEAKMTSAQADYLGHVPRPCVPSIMREHDVVCILSRSNEPFALVTLEAMASGCAVIASDRGGLPESCGGAAILVDPDDFDSVVQHLHALATDSALLQRHKAKSLERARRASWSVCTDTVERVLKCS